MSQVIVVKRRAFRNGHDQFTASTTSGLKLSHKPVEGESAEDSYWNGAKKLIESLGLDWGRKFTEATLDDDTRVFTPVSSKVREL